MCGIAGIVYRERNISVSSQTLRNMGDAIAHRGPDGEGFYRTLGVGLAHRRLSIIDVEGGKQPLCNEDGTIHVTFNGEIYNYQELTDWLVRLGHRFVTHSDTEVLVHLYEELGERMVERLRGMFAFAIWDRSQERLFLARDRVGIKPLYYQFDPDQFVFASEIKSILTACSFTPDIDPISLENYLCFGMVIGPRSIFQGIQQLPPGHTLTLNREHWQAQPKRYWQLRFEPKTKTVAEWGEAIQEKLSESVRLHLRADVPVGAFLSGGVDSTTLVALASQIQNSRLQTFSIGFEEETHCEARFARETSDKWNTLHTEEIIRPDAVQLLDRLAEYFDEPFADGSALPTHLLCRIASQKVKVAISGDGGDEAFAGYSRHIHDLWEDQLRNRIPFFIRTRLIKHLANSWPRGAWLPKPLRWKNLLTNLSLTPARAYANSVAICRQPLRRQLLNPDMLSHLQHHDPKEELMKGFQFGNPKDILSGMLAADTNIVLPDDYLVKVDRASMACGIEVRPPFLDHEFLELAAQIPSELKYREGTGKWILKESFRKILPFETRNRPKRGFEVPLDQWFRGALRDRFHDEVLKANGKIKSLLDLTAVQRLYQEHERGIQHGTTLWAILVLSHWTNQYLGVKRRKNPDLEDSRFTQLTVSSS